MNLLDPLVSQTEPRSGSTRPPFVPDAPESARRSRDAIARGLPAATSRAASGRRKLWQLDDHHHCLVLGTCLDMSEVRAIATRAGFEHDELEDHDIHHACVHAAKDRHHPLAIGLQKRLEAKFAADSRLFARAADEAARRVLWQSRLEDGDIGGALWALVTHPARDVELLAEVYGQVHMLQHGTCARESKLRRRAAKAVERRDALVEELDLSRAEARARLGEAAARIAALERDLTLARTERDEARSAVGRRRSTVMGTETRSEPLENRLETARTTLARQHALIEKLRREAAAHRAERLAATREREALQGDNARLECLVERLLEARDDVTSTGGTSMVGADNTDGAADERAARPSRERSNTPALCGRCVLVIGGQAQQCRHFRALVEANQGTFLHHDGGVEDKPARVAELVRRADAVLCPTEQVSHDAMRRAKRLCRADDKPMIYLQRSSLAAFADGLEQLSRTASSSRRRHA